MMRIALAIGFACYVALATGEVSVFEGAACTQRCPDDDSSGQCAPNCADCACCPHLRVMAVAAGAKPPVAVQSKKVPERKQMQPPSPEPGDILHVPKTHLA